MDQQEQSFKMGKRLKELRESKGLSHEKLKKIMMEKYHVKISRDSLMSYEISDEFHSKAEKCPNLKMRVEYLNCFSDLYGVSTDYLLGKTDIKTPDISVQEICEYTGISESAIIVLQKIKERESDDEPNMFNRFLSTMICNGTFQRMLCRMMIYRNAKIAGQIFQDILETMPAGYTQAELVEEIKKRRTDTTLQPGVRDELLIYQLLEDGDVGFLQPLEDFESGHFDPADLQEFRLNKDLSILLSEICEIKE